MEPENQKQERRTREENQEPERRTREDPEMISNQRSQGADPVSTTNQAGCYLRPPVRVLFHVSLRHSAADAPRTSE